MENKEQRYRASVYMTKSLYELLRKEAEKQKRTVSNLVRLIMLNYLKNKL